MANKYVHRHKGDAIISFSHEGNFEKTDKFLKKMLERGYIEIIKYYARMGVSALAAATPVRSGKTASSWDYEIDIYNDHIEIQFVNSNINKGQNIAILLQYGHGTRNGGYVKGIDYINPALQPVFEKMADNIWKEVNK